MDFAKTQQDLGFRAYKLFDSNFKKWQSIITDKDELMKQLEIFKEPLATRPADSYDLLVELLLKSGLPLSAKTEKRETSDGVPFYVAQDWQFVYALDGISDRLLKDIEAVKPKAFITLGNFFNGEKADEQMINWKLRLRESNIEFKII
jgi:adenine-specific DNA-methyltransferase